MPLNLAVFISAQFLAQKGEAQSMTIFHVRRNLKYLSSLLRFSGSLCLPCICKCPKARGRVCLVQLYFFDIWQALSVFRVD